MAVFEARVVARQPALTFIRSILVLSLLHGTLARPVLEQLGVANMDKGPASKEAFVTLLYGDKFLLGVRTLGQSLRESKTTRDIVVIAAGDLSQYAVDTLKSDGWRVKIVPPVHNPNMRPDRKYPTRFWAVYTKLNVFGLDEYEKVVFLDADTLVVDNMDDIFKCPGFCACLRHSERFNSGVMVIKPSKALFEDITNKIATIPSYTGGDQGFLNAYFEGFVDGPVFDPAQDYSSSSHKYMRLPSRYNADIGLYVLNSNRWLLDGDLKLIHYTLGAFKPWDWWCGWLIEEQSRWNEMRYRLPPDALGRSHGVTSLQLFAQNVFSLVPLVVAGFVARFMFSGWPHQLMPLISANPSFQMMESPPPLASIGAGYACFGASVFFLGYIIPSTVTPTWGWILLYSYFFMFSALLFGKYLHFCWHCGRLAGGQGALVSKAWSAVWTQSVLQAAVVAVLLLISPFLSNLLGIPGLVPKILLTAVGAIAANTAATFTFGSLGEAWYLAGKGESKGGDIPIRR